MSRKRVRRYCLPPLIGCRSTVLAAALLFSWWPASVHGGMTTFTRFCSSATNAARVHNGYCTHAVAANHRPPPNIAATHDVVRLTSSNVTVTGNARPTDDVRAVEDVAKKNRAGKTTDAVSSARTVPTYNDNNDEEETPSRCYKIKYTTPKTTTFRWSPKFRICKPNTQSAASNCSSATAAVKNSTTRKGHANLTEIVDNDKLNEIKKNNNNNNCTVFPPPCNSSSSSSSSDGRAADFGVKASKSPSRNISQMHIGLPKNWSARSPVTVATVKRRTDDVSTTFAAVVAAISQPPPPPPPPPVVKPKRKTRKTFSPPKRRRRRQDAENGEFRRR